MNYINVYTNIINNAKSRNLKRERGYCIHHVIPSIYFKTRKIASYKENLVKLTHKEHYVCHHLLSKTGCSKMVYAFWFMTHINKSIDRLSSSEYTKLSLLHQVNVSNQFKNRIMGDEHKKKIGDANKGNVSKFKGIKQSDILKKQTSDAIKQWWADRKKKMDIVECRNHLN